MCCVGARQSVLACFCGFAPVLGLGGGSELDVPAELFELPNEEPSSSFWLIFTFEICGAELVECCFVVQEVPANDEQRVRYGDQCSLLAPPFRYPPETDTEVAVLRS